MAGRSSRLCLASHAVLAASILLRKYLLLSLAACRDHALMNKAISATNAGTFATCTERLVPAVRRRRAGMRSAQAGCSCNDRCCPCALLLLLLLKLSAALFLPLHRSQTWLLWSSRKLGCSCFLRICMPELPSLPAALKACAAALTPVAGAWLAGAAALNASPSLLQVCHHSSFRSTVHCLLHPSRFNEAPNMAYTSPNRRSVEALLRKLLRMPHHPAVIVLHHYGWFHRCFCCMLCCFTCLVCYAVCHAVLGCVCWLCGLSFCVSHFACAANPSFPSLRSCTQPLSFP